MSTKPIDNLLTLCYNISMSWSRYAQPDHAREIDELGARLSLAILCTIRLSGDAFECHCGVMFPLYLVKGENWDLIRRKHEEEKDAVNGAG